MIRFLNLIFLLQIQSVLSYFCVYKPIANPSTTYIDSVPCTLTYQIPLYDDISSKMLQYNKTLDWSLIINQPIFALQSSLTSGLSSLQTNMTQNLQTLNTSLQSNITSGLTSLSTNMTQNIQTMSNSLQSNITSGLTSLSTNMTQNIQTMSNSLQSNITSGLASLSTNMTQNLQTVNNSLQNQLQILETEIAQSKERIKQLELYKYLSFINSGVIVILMVIMGYSSCKSKQLQKQKVKKQKKVVHPKIQKQKKQKKQLPKIQTTQQNSMDGFVMASNLQGWQKNDSQQW